MSNQAKDWQEGSYTVRVKDGEVEVSTIRTVTKTYLTCASDVHKKYVATARCAPEDEFSLSMGVALAMERLNKELGKDKIEVGDKVRIKNCSLSYTTYARWIKKNIDDVGLVACFVYGQIPYEDDAVYVVKAIAPWDTNTEYNVSKMLAYVQKYFVYNNGKVDDNEPCYLIDLDGLEKV